MNGLLEVVTLITSLLQVINRASAEIAAMSAMIERAKSEGRDLTDEELNQARAAAVAALARLA